MERTRDLGYVKCALSDVCHGLIAAFTRRQNNRVRVPRIRFTLRRLMAAIAVCAVSLAILREAPFIAVFVCPLIGSVLDVRKGRNGIIAATRAGAIANVIVGLFYMLVVFAQYPLTRIGAEQVFWILIILGLVALGGAVIGFTEGIAVWYLRYLATLPKRLRLRAERSARANSYRPAPRAR
jgi:hypothetical protein